MVDIGERVERLIAAMQEEMELLQVEKRIRGRVKRQMEKSQREYYLNEQMKAIQKELGDMEEAPNELDELGKEDRAGRDVGGGQAQGHHRARQAQDDVADVGRGDGGAQLRGTGSSTSRGRSAPGCATTSPRAETVLEADHYGLEKVKERILEYLAVQQRVRKLKGPDPVPGGSPRGGKDVARAVDRTRDGPQVRADVARRGP